MLSEDFEVGTGEVFVKCSETVDAMIDVISEVMSVEGIFIVTVEDVPVRVTSVGKVVGGVDFVTYDVEVVESPMVLVIIVVVVVSSVMAVEVFVVSVSPDG